MCRDEASLKNRLDCPSDFLGLHHIEKLWVRTLEESKCTKTIELFSSSLPQFVLYWSLHFQRYPLEGTESTPCFGLKISDDCKGTQSLTPDDGFEFFSGGGKLDTEERLEKVAASTADGYHTTGLIYTRDIRVHRNR